jgi:hypothetical protein
MQEHGLRPRAREAGLAVQVLGEESLVYDRDRDIAHCLSAVAARVWRGCDGERDVAAIAAFVGADEDLVADALDELRQKGLLADEPALPDPDPSGVSRRKALGRIARVVAGVTAIPLISSATITAPLASASGGTCAACTGQPGTQGSCDAGFKCTAVGVCVPLSCMKINSGGCSTCAAGKTCITCGTTSFCC